MRIPVPCGNEEMEPETSCIPVDGMVFSGNKEENILKPEKKGKKTEKNTSGRFNSRKNGLYYK